MENFLVPLMVFLAVVSLGGSALLAQRLRRKVLDDRLSGRADAAPFAASPAMRNTLLDAMTAIGGQMDSGTSSKRLREQLTRAGFHNPAADKMYLGAKALSLLTGVVLAWGVLMLMDMPLSAKLLVLLLGGGGCFFAPNIVVSFRTHQRCEEIRLHLPDALDLLEICISAGMGLDTAWNAVTDEIRQVCPHLADEMALTNLEIHLGASRAVALRHMADRTNGQDIASLVAIMVQSERFGTSIASALQTFATSMRQTRGQRAEERAEKMAVKLLAPMVLFVFPAVMVVMVGPAGLALRKVFG
jgi:tight adherence protein C